MFVLENFLDIIDSANRVNNTDRSDDFGLDELLDNSCTMTT